MNTGHFEARSAEEMANRTAPLNYFQGSSPNSAYELWKSRWIPPQKPVLALYGRVIVEYAPYGTESILWKPEGASFNAIVVDDSTGELSPGTEVVCEGENGTNFQHEEGRTLTAVEKEDILLIIPKADITTSTLTGITNTTLMGDQRCQAVAGNGEGKVPTTAPDYARPQSREGILPPGPREDRLTMS